MIKKLKWDSDHFGTNIAELDAKKLNANQVIFDSYIQSEKISIVQSCCEISDIEAMNALEKNGFLFADIKMSYVINLTDAIISKTDLLCADKKDVPLLREIAAESFVGQSRYYHNLFDKNKADDLYRMWIEKSVRGELDDVCFKIEHDGFPIGFITGKSLDDKSARIGIIGVNNKFQGKGAGSKLLNGLFRHYQLEGKERIYVSTQGKNRGANNFYIKNGFKIDNIAVWFYKKCD